MLDYAQITSMNRLGGKVLSKFRATYQSHEEWQSEGFTDVRNELQQQKRSGPRILMVESKRDRAERLQIDEADRGAMKESFELFAENADCKLYMVTQFNFPAHLMTRTWYECNGFAGSKRLKAGNISWFRILVKMVRGMKVYYWHEMTFFIHQPDNGHVTVICFEVPDDDVSDPDERKRAKADKPAYRLQNFLSELATILNTESAEFVPDWQYMQAKLLMLAGVVIDRGVWACSKAVRLIEKEKRPNPRSSSTPFDFPATHDLLRHALHSAEILKVASEILNAWLARYYKEQKWQMKLDALHPPQHHHHLLTQAQGPATPPSPHSPPSLKTIAPPDSDDDAPLPETCYYDDLSQTIQLINALQHRSASNEARLRNEISLAFNVVAQADTRAMRIISVVTLLFLPATFVSTLFSMSFFSQQEAGKTIEWRAAPKIWLYFAVAVPLTVLSIALWIWGLRLWEWFTGLGWVKWIHGKVFREKSE